jgi:hypothetical protein
MTLENVDIKPELYPKLVFIQQLSNKYFDSLMYDYGLTNRKEFFAGHEFIIKYSNDFIECNTRTDCDNYSIQFIDLYRIENSKNIRIDFWNLKEAVQIKKLYAESSKESESLYKIFMEKYFKKEDESEELNKPLNEYYKRTSAHLIEKNYSLHSELFKLNPELFKQNSDYIQHSICNKKIKITVEINGRKDLKLSTNLTFKEKIKKHLGI